MITGYFKIIILLFSTNLGIVHAQMPEWFKENMKQSIGNWVADNTAYQSEAEPFDQYGMEFRWGIGEQSMVGILYGLIDGKKQGVFWEFRQYWDYANNQGIIAQYGANGTFGFGPVKMIDENTNEVIQDFVSPQGEKTIHGHRNTLHQGELITQSYDISQEGEWKDRRSYTWIKIDN